MVSRVSLCGNRFTVGVSKPRKFSGTITRSKFCTQPKSREANRFGIRFITQSLTPRGTSFRTGKHSGYQFNYSLREFPRFFISILFSRFAKVRIIFHDRDSIHRSPIKKLMIFVIRDSSPFWNYLKKFQSEKIDFSVFLYNLKSSVNEEIYIKYIKNIYINCNPQKNEILRIKNSKNKNFVPIQFLHIFYKYRKYNSNNTKWFLQIAYKNRNRKIPFLLFRMCFSSTFCFSFHRKMKIQIHRLFETYRSVNVSSRLIKNTRITTCGIPFVFFIE